MDKLFFIFHVCAAAARVQHHRESLQTFSKMEMFMQISTVGATLLPNLSTPPVTNLDASTASANNKAPAQDSFSLSLAAQALGESASTATSNGTTTINVNDMSSAQMMAAAQTLGLTNVQQYMETSFVNINGSPVTMAEIAGQTRPSNQIATLESAAQNAASHDLSPAPFQNIANALLSQADSNGNITLDANTFQEYLTSDSTNTSSTFSNTTA